VLSLSPGETPLAEGEHVSQRANLWRKTGIGELEGEFAPEIYWHGAGLYRVSASKLP